MSDAEYKNDEEDFDDDLEVAEEDKQVNDPDVDTRPAEPVEHTSNVMGRRDESLPTENLSTPTNGAPGTARVTGSEGGSPPAPSAGS